MPKPPAPPESTGKKKLPPKKLPPKNPTSARAGKVEQAVDPTKKYELHTGIMSRGEKIILYGQSGMGKTTLATLAPKPVFVATDDGVDEIVHPVTGEPLARYKADTFQDVRNILNQPALFKGFETIVLDTATECQNYGVTHVLENVTKDGQYMKNLEAFGYSKGYVHLSDHMNLVRHDLQKLCDLGFNVIVICQQAPVKRSEAGVEDYLKDAPKLVFRPGVGATAALDFVEWAGHCFRVGYGDLRVKGKRVQSSGDRVVFVHPEVHFEAKSRTIPGSFPVVSFDDKADDSIWRFVFDQVWKDMQAEDGDE